MSILDNGIVLGLYASLLHLFLKKEYKFHNGGGDVTKVVVAILEIKSSVPGKNAAI